MDCLAKRVGSNPMVETRKKFEIEKCHPDPLSRRSATYKELASLSPETTELTSADMTVAQ
jgi:hypothetical protein